MIKRNIKKTFLMFKHLRKVYNHGGYSTYNLAKINYGGEVLKGKKVLITGGGSGIGLSIAKKCLLEGAAVVITGRNEKKLQQVVNEINNPLLKIQVWDISETSLIKSSLQKTKSLLGGDIDVLINNAGVMDGVSFPNVKEEVWDKIYATNSKGLFFLTQTLCKEWIDSKDKRLKKIINISSQGGFVGALQPYRMTKWDIAGLTQGLGVKLASEGIIVNGIAPGIIISDMQSAYQKQKENIYSHQNPINRVGLPEEIAELALFMLSDAANFIVGQTIICDGGYSLR